MTKLANSQLQPFMERLMRLDEERQEIVDDMKDVIGEAKAAGYNPKIVRKVLAEMKRDKAERDAEREMMEAYLTELGLW